MDEDLHVWYEWKYGCVTIEWPIKVFGWWRATGIIRVHNSEEVIPGPYHSVATIIVKRARYEIMGFTNCKSLPPRKEFRAAYEYLHSLGLRKHQHLRAKGGRVHVIYGEK